MKTPSQKERFQEMRETLYQAGYRDKDVTFGSGKAATILGGLTALPLVVLFGALYRFFLLDRAHLTDLSGITFYITLIAIILISLIAHELLHGIGWAISSGKGWSVVRFNINAMMPSCSCQSALTRGQYLVGVLLPFLVLGTGSVVFLFVYPGTVSVLTMAVNFVAAGADLLIALRAAKEKGALIADHPTQAGYIAFCK